ncbi:glycosyltransferase family 4 protein [Brevibacterium jeotgali]|uniref:Glycosyltransferase involved in cell wall bisynthesis n=1 Tax=Brevibacterium jeotgali TaxID=1262550 RepID=A0A2H1L6I1_9MICO|nr:glycosyltransferase family 4 protein [Brevibacterium jeotgali]TWC02596.1 glycosyltransferase involved in cell wall biosynthesis [Brevibacterium jeotgali]SMY12506.1 Glycosyltransferase involved in cell wall bisynthesis [Brevibacterium jeotgali]
MRVLIVLGTSTGGVGTHVAALARSLAQAGDTVGVIGPPQTQEHFGFDDRPRVRFAPLPISTTVGPADAAVVTRLRRLVTTFRADVVHAHGFRASLVTLAALSVMRRRPGFVSSWHNTLMGQGMRGRLERTVATAIARGADLVLGASQDLVDLAQDLGAGRSRFAPAASPPQGVVEDVNSALLRASLTRELGISRSAALLLAVGRIAPQKDYDVLIDALADIAHDHPEAQCLIAGSADEQEQERLTRRIEEHAQNGRRPAVHFLGQRSDVAALNQVSDVFLLSSRWEARALVLQEAMLAGRAIVATATGGTPELVGDAGILVPQGDPQAFAAGLRTLLDDSQLRADLGRRAALRALDLPDEEEAAQTVRAAYTEVSR